MGYKYYVVKEELYSDHEGGYTAYGIAVQYKHTVYTTVSDISTDIKKVQTLADYCNRLQLYPKQLREVVEDFLTEQHLQF